MASYSELLHAVQDGSEKALNRAVHTAIEEKSRYIAERIARTEAARAWADGFLEKYQDDDMVVAYRWELSSRHPHYDICDLYADADLWGLGAGIYPKDHTPNLPVHSHCLCHLSPVYEGEIAKTPHSFAKAGGEMYIKGLNESQKRQLLGVNGYQRYQKGEDWRKLARNYSPQVLKLSLKSDIIKLEGAGTMYRHTSRKDGIEPISKQRLDELTVPLKKLGVSVLYGEDWVEEHLAQNNAEASTLGTDAVLFSKNVSLSGVLEERHHVMQNIQGANDDKEARLRELLNEIDAKQYLLRVAKQYQIPRLETELTQKQLEQYKQAVQEYQKSAEGDKDV